jgi:hypothetical protein
MKASSGSIRAASVALAIFLLDVCTPNGLLDGFPYVIVILMCGSLPSPRAAPLMALALMPALLLGYALSPMGAPPWMAVTNRLAAAATLWLVAMFVRHIARLHLNEHRLQRAVRSASTDREGISQWLRDDVDLELQAMEWRLNRLQRCAESPDLRTESLILRRTVARARHAVLAEAARLGSTSAS